jgi:rare lipoprotein A
MKVYFSILSLGFLFLIFSNPSFCVSKSQKAVVYQDTLKLNTKPFKENAHASYYSNKFNGRKTASGEIFDNKKYTAAHKTLKFGTKLKVTNVANSEWIIVVVNDRGPSAKGREIDLSKSAFMEIADNKNLGKLTVTIEIVLE